MEQKAPSLNDSKVVLTDGGVIHQGKDAVWLFRAINVKIGLKAALSGRLITRGATKAKMRDLASEYTHKKYKRGEEQKALDDLEVWINNMRSAMPIEDERSQPLSPEAAPGN